MKHLKKSFLILGTVFLVSLFSSNLFAFEEKVTVYNNLDYPIIAIYRAAGYTGVYCGYYEREGTSLDGNCVTLVKTAVEIPAHGSGYATFGAGTSARHVVIALPGQSVTGGLLRSSNGVYNKAGDTPDWSWYRYFVGKDLVINSDSFVVDWIDYGEGYAEDPIIAEIVGHGCDHKFNVGLNRSGTLTVNEIYFTGEVPSEGDLLTTFNAYCDCEKTESRR